MNIKKLKTRFGVLRNSFRYLDDLLSIDDNKYLAEVVSSIYPAELKLTCTNPLNSKCTEFLDLDLSIIDGKIHSKVFDKRRQFPFKVINFPDLKFSNVPKKPSCGIYFSQILRILRICNKLEYFVVELEQLTKIFLGKGFEKSDLLSIFNRFLIKYCKEWGKFGFDIPVPECLR